MTALRFTLVAAVAALAAAALPGSSLAGNECNGVPECISVPGPWVVVPAHGEASFLLECPGRGGIVAGIDALVTSQDVRVTCDGQIASPVAPGRTTTRYAFFRAVSSSGKRGRVPAAARLHPAQHEPQHARRDADHAARRAARPRCGDARPRARLGAAPDARLHEGRARSSTSWDALTFGTAEPPELGARGRHPRRAADARGDA